MTNLCFTLKRYQKWREAPPLLFFFFFDLITSPQQWQPFKAFKDSQTPYTDTHSIVQKASDTSFLEIVCCYISYICHISSYCYNQDTCTAQPTIYFSLCPGHWTAGNESTDNFALPDLSHVTKNWDAWTINPWTAPSAAPGFPTVCGLVRITWVSDKKLVYHSSQMHIILCCIY